MASGTMQAQSIAVTSLSTHRVGLAGLIGRVDVRLGPRQGRDMAGVLFDDHAKLEDLGDFVLVEGGNCVSAARPERHETLRLEPIHRLAQWNSTHVEAFREPLLTQQLPRRIGPVEYATCKE